MGRSQISRSLDCLRSLVFNGNSGGPGNAPRDAACENFMGGHGVGGRMDALSCLRILQAPLAKETLSSAKDIGRLGRVPLLLQTAERGITVLPDEIRRQR